MTAGEVPVPRTLAELMARAWAMEVEAAERYEELADAMESHNNREVAALFRKMAGYEDIHARQILGQMGWDGAPPAQSAWTETEAPETTPSDEVHYLMQPWHALQLALAAEERAERFFAHLAEVATVDAVREAARAMQAEEQEHVRLVREWLGRVEPPPRNWSDDPDPPRYNE